MSSISKAYDLYSKHIYDEEKIELLKAHGLKVAGSVSSVMWELFGAMLTGRTATGTTGADLNGWEVKSAKQGGSFEYQYHLNTGEQKLNEDCEVNHLFCTYSENYQDVTVRVLKGSELSEPFFNKWKPLYFANYDKSAPDGKRRQRFRKNIPYRYVENNGTLVLEIKEGKLLFRDDSVIDRFN